MKWTFQSELCWIKILDFENLNGKKSIKKLTCIWHKRRHIFLFFFSSYFYIKKTCFQPYTCWFSSVSQLSSPHPSLVSLVEEDDLEAGLEVWMISCAPQHSGVTVFSWKMLSQGCFVTLSCVLHHGQSFLRIFPYHTSHSEYQNSYSTGILTPTASWNHSSLLQPLVLIDLFALMN